MSWSREEANEAAWYDRHPEYQPELPVCANCRRPTPPEELTYLEEWNYMACPACAEEARLTEGAEWTCPVLFGQVIAAGGVKEIKELLEGHEGSQCAMCGSDRRAEMDREPSSHPGSARRDREVA